MGWTPDDLKDCKLITTYIGRLKTIIPRDQWDKIPDDLLIQRHLKSGWVDHFSYNDLQKANEIIASKFSTVLEEEREFYDD